MNDGQSTRVERLAALVDESRGLLEQAQSTSDWEALMARESHLRARLAGLLAASVGDHELTAVRIALQELLALNQQTVQAVEARKADAFRGLKHTALVRRAAKAYGHAASA
ncbi:MAG: hypothetical protein P8011_15170 [Acidihalobacter sp.]|uniref:hypothetical protein n=1 Tax=Acidihalobacter sp. TaxID=1872108 RepID=UPI00307F642F